MYPGSVTRAAGSSAAAGASLVRRRTAAVVTVAAALVACSTAAGLTSPPGGELRQAARADSHGCVVPDVRGYETSYAHALIDQARCRLGAIRREGTAFGAGAVTAQRPAPGTHVAAGRTVALVIGPRPRGCRQQRFQQLDHTSQLRVWRNVVGDPAERGSRERRWSSSLQACTPPSGPVVTLWSINSEEAIQDSSSFSELRVLGTVVAFLESSSSQYGTVETLEVLDLSRHAPGLSCASTNQPASARYCVLSARVGEVGEFFGTGAPDGIAEYAIDAAGDVAWLQKQGGLQTLYIDTPASRQPVSVEAGGGLGGVVLSGGVLSWSSAGQQHSQPVAAAAASAAA